ncbi:hypothetical protein FACS189454_05330 [Planctomycetales bacterium]|nr:hypothetical protein FACS189454_05330 [Planctomycetales bacterium]
MFNRLLKFFLLSAVLFYAGTAAFAQRLIQYVPADINNFSQNVDGEYFLIPDYYRAQNTSIGASSSFNNLLRISGSDFTAVGNGTNAVGLLLNGAGVGGLDSYILSIYNGTRYSSYGVNGGYGTVILNSNFYGKDSTFDFYANGSSRGLWATGNILIDDSQIWAAGNNGGTGLYSDENVYFRNVSLTLSEGNGLAVDADTAEFDKNSTLIQQFDALNPANAGQMDANLQIAVGTNLRVNIVNAAGLQTGQAVPLRQFNTDNNSQIGNFMLGDEDQIYRLQWDNPDAPTSLIVTKTRSLGAVVSDENSSFANGLENGLKNNHDKDGYGPANGLYDELVNSDRANRDQSARRSSGWQATVFARVLMNNSDMRQNNLFNQLTMMRTAAEYDALAEGMLRGQVVGQSAHVKPVNPWTRWVSWDGNLEHLGGESAGYEGLRFNSSAFNVGMARRASGFSRRVLTGLSFSYNYGNFRDTSDSADAGYSHGDYNGFAAFFSARVDKPHQRHWTDWTLGGMVDVFDMDRRDYLGAVHQSKTTAGLFRLGWMIGRDFGFRTHKHYYYYEHSRLSPIIGLDYSVLSQGGMHEDNMNGLALNGGSDWMHSLRGKMGLEFAYKYTDLAFSLHSYLRYEFLDRGVELPMSFATAPAIIYQLGTQDIDRISGILGFNLTSQLFENQDVGFSYDSVFVDGGNSHWFDLRYVRRY